MNEGKVPMTLVGKKRLEEELKQLIQTARPNVIKAIEEARSHGDLSENAEYSAAKEQQALIEGRIQEIQSKIVAAQVIDPSTIKSDKIVFGAKVVLLDLETEEESEYQIVGIDEADVKEKKISVHSPLARAIIGKKSGDEVVVQSPKGERDLKVVKFYYE